MHICPVCLSERNHFVFKVKDYTVSQQSFEIWHCEDCQHRFTADAPAAAEIGKYYQSEDYISHSNTQKGIVNRLYHIVRNFALKSKRNLILTYTQKKQGKILDIGCGIGAFLDTMQKANWEIKGLEPDEGARKQALSLFNIQPENPQNLFSLPADSFDAVTMWHVLEHVHELHAYLKQIDSILKKDGVFFIAVPNYTSKDAEIYQEYWAAYDVPRHLYHFSPESMSVLLSKYNFQIQAHKLMPFDSFYISLISEKYKTGKTSLFKGFWNGFVSYWATLKDPKKCSSVLYVVKKAPN